MLTRLISFVTRAYGVSTDLSLGTTDGVTDVGDYPWAPGRSQDARGPNLVGDFQRRKGECPGNKGDGEVGVERRTKTNPYSRTPVGLRLHLSL